MFIRIPHTAFNQLDIYIKSAALSDDSKVDDTKRTI